MPATCFTCGDKGHISADCPNNDQLDTRPTWCGMCDRRTRHIGINADLTIMARCPNCHPSPRKPMPQHRRCSACKMIVYSWDTAGCGQHESPVAPDRRLPLDEIHRIERRESAPGEWGAA